MYKKVKNLGNLAKFLEKLATEGAPSLTGVNPGKISRAEQRQRFCIEQLHRLAENELHEATERETLLAAAYVVAGVRINPTEEERYLLRAARDIVYRKVDKISLMIVRRPPSYRPDPRLILVGRTESNRRRH